MSTDRRMPDVRRPDWRRPDFTLVMPHIPKTAGTSLRLLLEGIYGDAFLPDYGDRPLQTARWQRRSQALGQCLRHAGRRLPAGCIYGHFLPLKYRLARQTRFALWLRDPVQRVISRYHHYLRACAAGETVHARWGLVPGLSLTAFARLPQYRNTCAEYMWAFPLKRFAFVGAVEQIDQSLPRFLKTFGLPQAVAMPQANSNPDREASGYQPTAAERGLIEQMNLADVRFYERLLGQCAG